MLFAYFACPSQLKRVKLCSIHGENNNVNEFKFRWGVLIKLRRDILSYSISRAARIKTHVLLYAFI